MSTADIDAMLGEGLPFEAIEDRIEAARLHPEVKGVLWLYAWTQADVDDRRRVVAEMALALS